MMMVKSNPRNKVDCVPKAVRWHPENVRSMSSFFDKLNTRILYLTKRSSVFIEWFDLFSDRFKQYDGWHSLSMKLPTEGMKKETASSLSVLKLNRTPIMAFSLSVSNIADKANQSNHLHRIEIVKIKKPGKTSDPRYLPIIRQYMNKSQRTENISYQAEIRINLVKNKEHRLFDSHEQAANYNTENSLYNNITISKPADQKEYKTSQTETRLAYAKPSLITEEKEKNFEMSELIQTLNSSKPTGKTEVKREALLGYIKNTSIEANEAGVMSEIDIKKVLESVDTSTLNFNQLYDYSRLFLASPNMSPEKVVERVREIISQSVSQTDLSSETEFISSGTHAGEDSHLAGVDLNASLLNLKTEIVNSVVRLMDRNQQNRQERKGYY